MLVCAVAVGRKVFFSEEKKQKTFARAVADRAGGVRQVAKVFWFFFSKKNAFLSYGPVTSALRQVPRYVPSPPVWLMKSTASPAVNFALTVNGAGTWNESIVAENTTF